MDILGITIKVLTVDVSKLLTKLFYQYINMHIQSTETRRQIKEIAKLEAEHRKALTNQEIEFKKFLIAHEKAEKYNQIKLQTSKKIRSFIVANGFRGDETRSSDLIESLYGSLSGQTNSNFQKMLNNMPWPCSDYYFARQEKEYNYYSFRFCRKCRSMIRRGEDSCDFCGTG